MTNLISERLVLRKWELFDLEDFHLISSNRKVAELADFRLKTCKEESLKNLQYFMKCSDETTWEVSLKELNQVIVWALALKETNQAIGWLEVCEASFNPDETQFEFIKEIGFVLAEEFWGQGFMTEALKYALSYLFQEEGLQAIVCSHFIANKQSEGLIRKCGFEFYREDEEERYYYIEKNKV